MVDDDEEDTVSFHYKNTFIFRGDLSGNLTGDETIVVPHPSNYSHFAYSFFKRILLVASDNFLNCRFSIAAHVTVITGIYLASSVDRQAMLGRIETGIKNIFHNPSDAFYTGQAMDLLWNGIEMDCTEKVC